MTEGKNAQPAELPRGVRKVARGWEIDLDYPIDVDGVEVETLKLRRTNVGDRLFITRSQLDETAGPAAINAAAADMIASVGARMAGLTDEQIQTIDTDDWDRIQEVIVAHLGGE